MWPLESLWIVHSPNDVTSENSINLKLKALLMGSFWKAVKLNGLLQDQGDSVEKALGNLDLLLASLVPCIKMLGLELNYLFSCLFDIKFSVGSE